MTTAEIVAFEYGKRLMAECRKVIESDQPKKVPDEAKLGPTEMAALNRLGQASWLEWVQKGAAALE